MSEGELDALVAAESLWAREGRLRGSVSASMHNMLLGYADPTVAGVGERCDVDLDAWLSGPNTIYVVATADEQTRLRPVAGRRADAPPTATAVPLSTLVSSYLTKPAISPR